MAPSTNTPRSHRQLPALLLVLLLAAGPVLAQDFGATYTALKQQYPEEQAVYWKYYEDIDISVQADSLLVRTKNYKEMVHLGDMSQVFAKDVVYASYFHQVSNIQAATLLPNKKKHRTLKVTDFKETFDRNSQVFYDDTKLITFMYPAIEPGAHTVLQYDELLRDARFIGSFFFSSNAPLAHGRFTLTLDPGIEVDLKLRHDVENKVKVTKEKVGARTRYVYEIRNSEKYKSESSAPTIKYYTPHLNIVVQSFTTSKGVKKNVLSSADDLYTWYKTFIKGLEQHQDETLKGIVAELVEGAKTEEEKVRRIFYWVQENIKYIAFEDGMRGLIPHNGGYVCEKRFGDCKDMASILVNMMQHAGIKGHFTWIGTRDIPYDYSELPSPLVDNHMIATYMSGGRPYFLDATAQYSPFELPSSMIQGKEALIALSEGEYKIVRVPEVPKEQNRDTDTSYFRLEKGVIKGRGHVTLSGYNKVFNTYRISKTSEQEVKEYLTRRLGRGSNKFYLEQYQVSDVQNLDKPTRIGYEFSIADYYREIGEEIYLNMNLDKAYFKDFIDKDRKLAIENEYKYTKQTVSVLELPANYTLAHLPADDAFSNAYFGYSIKYRQEKGRIVLHKELYVNYLLLQPEGFAQWNEAIKKLSEAYSETLILKRKRV
ncbi:DUF3857 domain-containing protein [Cesiribacter andamanensis]|uniref:Transglutaminase-like domain-containing protein n=1 Tax=Cesiribacter andamanensis AMV16 TaxID=1279009 RepID=M7NQD9_9BACT|nr:DUF3857 domain-containing protein [Cesiribacter andamanensis]EMR03940.1 hypothetical protein ADICEAN_00907 [Cesiribacter andamanensis AMV16]